ncbi:MAG: DNA starvation/stationary phase protection protein [Pirellulaceae bacterium]|nr:DNA starvation/stationary phase protection protein [Planctomycetales bacterium]
MTTATLPREILKDSDRETVVGSLQTCLTTLIDLSLQLKQLHWNVLGDRFLSFHTQLDKIIDTSRAGADEVAERIAALGVTADGRAMTIADESRLEALTAGRQSVDESVTAAADRLLVATQCLRDSMDKIGNVDKVSEDILIEFCRALEKHLWMVQSQER